MAGIVRLLGAWGREVAASNAGSDELLRGLKVIDDAVVHAFGAYRSRLEHGEEADELVGATEDLVAASVAVLDAMREAAAREADPEKRARIFDFFRRRRSTRAPASSRDEGSARSAS